MDNKELKNSIESFLNKKSWISIVEEKNSEGILEKGSIDTWSKQFENFSEHKTGTKITFEALEYRKYNILKHSILEIKRDFQKYIMKNLNDGLFIKGIKAVYDVDEDKMLIEIRFGLGTTPRDSKRNIKSRKSVVNKYE